MRVPPRTRVLLASLVALGAACGGGDAPAPDDAATPAPAATAIDSAPPTVASAGGSDGAAIYTRCVACHQANGAGLAGAFPPLANSEWVTGDPGIPIRVVLQGMIGEVTVAGQTYNSVMLPYGGTGEMSDAEVAAVLTYVRSSFGNSASAVSAEDVAAVRAATAGRTTQWTAAELQSRP